MPEVVAVSTFGGVVLGILAFCIWVAIAFWPARVAGRKGHSFLGFFILSLFVFPIALIAAYMVHDRRALSPTATPRPTGSP